MIITKIPLKPSTIIFSNPLNLGSTFSQSTVDLKIFIRYPRDKIPVTSSTIITPNGNPALG